ncbi:MAG: hypothetical protein FWG85_07400 [Bacteroidetes bacterium]|nr:hypothetical protein [Bacteroidota bacterium]
MNNINKNKINKPKNLLSAVVKMQTEMPQDYNWKQDYIKSIEEKYENIHRR